MNSRVRVCVQMRELVEAEAARISSQTGLTPIHSRMHAHSGDAGSSPEDGPSMSQDPTLQLSTIADALRAMFVAVSSPDAIPEYEQLAVPRLRVGVSKQVAAAVATQYREVYEAVADQKNGYSADGGVSAIKNTPQQTATVLGVDE